MSVDAGGRLLFVANEGNATLLVVDLRTMKVTDTESVLVAPAGDSDFPGVSDDGRYVSFVTEDETTANQGIPSGEGQSLSRDRAHFHSRIIVCPKSNRK